MRLDLKLNNASQRAYTLGLEFEKRRIKNLTRDIIKHLKDGKDIKEVAKILKISTGTVRKYIHKNNLTIKDGYLYEEQKYGCK